MPYGMYISAEGAQAQAKRMETIANNLANVDTPGFKRDVTTFRARFAEAIEEGIATPGDGSINDIGGGVMVASIRTQFGAGPIERTGVATDLAIEGDGFFAIRKEGQTLLTRAGNFRLTSDGRLVTREGNMVLNDTGGPIAIDPDLGPWQFTVNGGLQQGGGVTDHVAVVRPRSRSDLVKIGDNLFRSLAPTRNAPLADRRVRQGYLEGSTVNPTAEMMTLIETSRAFEANTKLIQNQDSMIGSLIRRVLQT
ncbi:MAG: flagellar basal-body rod protein FlgF [Pirellulales bacterium]